jgi:hypothetical protein
LLLTAVEFPFLLADFLLVFLLEALRAGAFFLLGTFFVDAFFLLAAFFLTPDLLVDFLLAAFFRDGFLRLTAFLAATFLLGFFRAIFFLLTAFFFFAGEDFFLLTLRFFDADFLGAPFLTATFFLDAGAFFRFLLALFFAGMWYSCRTEKRPGLYMACARREARFSPKICGTKPACRFAPTIVLSAHFHYTSAISRAPGKTPHKCDSAKSSSLASNPL